MDYNDPSRRQNLQNTYSAQYQPPGNAPSSSSFSSTPTDERFRRSSHIQHSPTTNVPTRASSDQVYGFTRSSQHDSRASASVQAPQYTDGLQNPDVSRQQGMQQYRQYGLNSAYGLAQQTLSATPSPYHPVQRSTQWPNTASETLTSQFGSGNAAQTSQYYLAGLSVPTSATMPDLMPSQLPSQYETMYAQASPLTQTHASTIMDPTQASSNSSQYAQQSSQSTDPRLSTYQTQIRTIFFHVREGLLQDVGSMLLEVSRYLLSNVEALGLTRDDDKLHDERIRTWDEFNRAWLATLQAQIDMTHDYFHTRQTREPASLLNRETLETLSCELVRLCDSIEKHGLVDYQMGVAEEEIMDLLIRCLNQLDPDTAPSADNGAESSSSAPR